MRTVAESLRWRALRHPDLPMTWFQGRTRTYGEMDASTTALAAGLVAEHGIRPGDHVCILDKNSDDYLELMFALDKCGAISTPLNWRLTAGEVKGVIEDARPALLVAGPDFRETAEGSGQHPLTFAQLTRVQGGADPHLDDEMRVTWQLYTSGTTGIPKGAMLTNRNLFAASLAALYEVPELHEGGRSLVAMPLSHAGGSAWALASVANGSCAVITREVDPLELLRVIPEQRVETGFLVPAVLLFLSQIPGAQSADWSMLRNIVYGASPITQAVLERSIGTFKCRFTQVYGLTETSGAFTALAHEHHCGERLLSCGRPMFGADVRVVDLEGAEVPRGDIGEIVYRGDSLMAGYWNRPQDTAAVVLDGWFHTGDAGSMDAEGFLYIKDRIKDMIVSGGENVYPAEVESVLAHHPAVADVAVIGIPDDRWGETVKAVVVRRPGVELGERELIEWTRDRLAGFKRPTSVDFIESIPRNPSGKILKRELREPYWEGAARQVN